MEMFLIVLVISLLGVAVCGAAVRGRHARQPPRATPSQPTSASCTLPSRFFVDDRAPQARTARADRGAAAANRAPRPAGTGRGRGLPRLPDRRDAADAARRRRWCTEGARAMASTNLNCCGASPQRRPRRVTGPRRRRIRAAQRHGAVSRWATPADSLFVVERGPDRADAADAGPAARGRRADRGAGAGPGGRLVGADSAASLHAEGDRAARHRSAGDSADRAASSTSPRIPTSATSSRGTWRRSSDSGCRCSRRCGCARCSASSSCGRSRARGA